MHGLNCGRGVAVPEPEPAGEGRCGSSIVALVRAHSEGERYQRTSADEHAVTAWVAERAAAREYAGVRREIALAGQVVVLEARVATAEAHAAMVERELRELREECPRLGKVWTLPSQEDS